MDTLRLEIRYAARQLLKSRGYTVAAVFSISLGIGANSALFTAVSRIFLTPLPVARPAELVQLLTVFSGRPGTGVSHLNYRDFRARLETFSSLIAHATVVANLGSGPDTERVSVTLVSDNYFEGLGVVPQAGRALGENERAPVAVVSGSLARRRDAGVGETIRLNGRAFTVAGIAPDGFGGLSIGILTDVWVPLEQRRGVVPPGLGRSHERREVAGLSVVGYLRESVSLEEARSEVSVVARQLEEAYPEANRDRGATIEPFSLLRGFPSAATAVSLVAAMTGLVLLIGCANVTSFMLARGWSRRRETSVRLALGSSGRRLAQQVLVESFLIAALATLVGFPMVRLLPLLVDLARPPIPIPLRLDLTPDARVYVFIFGLALVTSFLVGVLPLLRARALDPAVHLRASRTGVESSLGFSARYALMSGQIALGLVGVIIATLFLRSLSEQLATDVGFSPEGVVGASIDLPPNRYDEVSGPELVRRLIARVEAVNGVESTSMATHIPFWDDFNVGFGRLHVDGSPPGDPERAPGAVKAFVSPGYFETLDLPLLRGRGILSSDRRDSEPVAVISESVAETLFGGEEPLGRHISFEGVESFAFHASRSERISYRVVGVAKDAKHFSVRQRRTNFLYVPLAQEFSPSLSLLVRNGPAGSASPRQIVRELAAVEPELAVFNVRPLPEIVLQSLFFLRAGAALLALFGWMAACLAALGVYGVVAYVASHRTPEVGLRMALGASASDIARWVLRDVITRGSIGLGAGFGAAYLLANAARALLASVSPTDATSFGAAGLAVALLVMGAALIPALKTSRLDPAAALRQD